MTRQLVSQSTKAAAFIIVPHGLHPEIETAVCTVVQSLLVQSLHQHELNERRLEVLEAQLTQGLENTGYSQVVVIGSEMQ